MFKYTYITSSIQQISKVQFYPTPPSLIKEEEEEKEEKEEEEED